MMEPLKNLTCSCEPAPEPMTASGNTKQPKRLKNITVVAMGMALWYGVYLQLTAISNYLTFHLFGLVPNSQLGEAVRFFVYDTPKVLMLLGLVVFGVGIIRTFFTPVRTRQILAGRREIFGNILASVLGIVTPFCSCSAVPLFIGFVTAGIPLGVTFSFLISAPMVNEIALVLLYGLMGWKVAALYLGTGLLIAAAAGWIIGRLHMEGYVEDWVRQVISDGGTMPAEQLTWNDRLTRGWEAVKEIVAKVWIYIVAGIAVGAGIHGYVPEGFMAALMGKDAWWSVPAAVAVGIPMYSNVAGIVPVIHALLEKGAALGTVLAFMMSVIALSLPETVILRKVLKPVLIGVFLGVVGLGILLVGHLFNMLV